jgi:three-Cys-motif partner protein
MAQKKFGGVHTKQKLDVIENYLKTYCTALKNQNFTTIYIDAFAGSGEVPTGDSRESLLGNILDAEEVIKGSALRALDLEIPFDQYAFIDLKRKKISSLQQKLESHALFPRCDFRVGSADDQLADIVSSNDWNRSRAVCFLDPFGNQVSFSTLKLLADTQAVDIWYLFPAFWGVSRQISNTGNVHHTHVESLNKLYGTDEWKEVFMQQTTASDLFGAYQKNEKTVDPEIATRYMQERMKTIFSGVVLDKSLPLGRNGAHQYSLIYAAANPSPKAVALCRRLANAVLK